MAVTVEALMSVDVSEAEMTPGERFLNAWGSMAGQIWVSDDFEFSEEELDEMYAEWDEEDKLFGLSD
jgi:hypothetical protein